MLFGIPEYRLEMLLLVQPNVWANQGAMHACKSDIRVYSMDTIHELQFNLAYSDSGMLSDCPV